MAQKYPRNPLKRQPQPSSGGTYKRENGKLTKLHDPGGQPVVAPTTVKSSDSGGSKKKED